MGPLELVAGGTRHVAADFRLTVPPSRDRMQELPQFVRHFLAEVGTGMNLGPQALLEIRHAAPGHIG